MDRRQIVQEEPLAEVISAKTSSVFVLYYWMTPAVQQHEISLIIYLTGLKRDSVW